jgi:hypothetical protein
MLSGLQDREDSATVADADFAVSHGNDGVRGKVDHLFVVWGGGAITEDGGVDRVDAREEEERLVAEPADGPVALLDYDAVVGTMGNDVRVLVDEFMERKKGGVADVDSGTQDERLSLFPSETKLVLIDGDDPEGGLVDYGIGEFLFFPGGHRGPNIASPARRYDLSLTADETKSNVAFLDLEIVRMIKIEVPYQMGTRPDIKDTSKGGNGKTGCPFSA